MLTLEPNQELEYIQHVQRSQNTSIVVSAILSLYTHLARSYRDTLDMPLACQEFGLVCKTTYSTEKLERIDETHYSNVQKCLRPKPSPVWRAYLAAVKTCNKVS